MRYDRFEWLVIGVGAAAIFGTLGLALTLRSADLEYAATEMIAQVMLLGVLIGAVHWGRRGGFVAALIATVAYIAMRLPSFVAGGALLENTQLILIHTITYGAVGILGGEMCGRIKYFFVRLENALNIDESSRVYNQRFVARVLRTQLGQHARYGSTFSIGVVMLSPRLTSELRPGKVTALVRTAADQIRNELRLVDEIGRLDDGRFVLLLPHTGKDGARVAADRVCRGVRDVLGARDESVTCELYGVPEDIAAITALADSIESPEDAEDAAEEQPDA